MIQITPNEMHRAKSVLGGLSADKPIATKYRYAVIIKKLDEAIEVFKGTIKGPDMSEYQDSVRTVFGEDMKGQPEKKLKLLESINKKYIKQLDEMRTFEKASEEAASTVRVDVEVTPLKFSDLPEDITTENLSILIPLLAGDHE